jgi:NADH-quinone oxidoreductase subunit L
VNPLETVTPVAASGLFSYAWLLIAIPAASAAFLLLSGRLSDAWGHLLGTLAPIASFVIGLTLFVQLLGRSEEERSVALSLYSLIPTGGWDVNVGLQVDQLHRGHHVPAQRDLGQLGSRTERV